MVLYRLSGPDEANQKNTEDQYGNRKEKDANLDYRQVTREQVYIVD